MWSRRFKNVKDHWLLEIDLNRLESVQTVWKAHRKVIVSYKRRTVSYKKCIISY